MHQEIKKTSTDINSAEDMAPVPQQVAADDMAAGKAGATGRKSPGQGGGSPRISDGFLTFGGILVLWVLVEVLLAWARPHLDLRSLVYLSGFLTQGGIGLVIGMYIQVRGLNLKILGYRPVAVKSSILSIVKAYGTVFLLDMAYGIYLTARGYTPEQPEAYKILFAQHDLTFVLLNLILAAGVAPFLEETVFRGIIFSSLRQRLGFWLAAGVSAALFSGLHMDMWGFIPRFFLGMALAYLYEKHQSLYPSIGLHAVNNGFALVLNLVLKLPA